MFSKSTRKILVSLVLLPIGIFFLSCCCLKADAQLSKASSGCKSCPQKETSQKEHTDCPHANLKAVFAAYVQDIKAVQDLLVSAVLSAAEDLFLNPQFAVVPFDYPNSPPVHLSLHSQNPILRV